MDLLMGPPFHYRISFLQGEFQMKPYAFKCNSALRVWPQEDVCPQGWGHALTYHSDNLKICWLKNCSPGLISDVFPYLKNGGIPACYVMLVYQGGN